MHTNFLNRMDLLPSFQRVLEDYPVQREFGFAGNDLAQFIRRRIPERILELLGENDRYIVTGSAGKGNWAACPWIAILDRLITKSPQVGFYVVYLFRVNFDGFYLSLNQGVTQTRRLFGKRASQVLAIQAQAYATQLGILHTDVHAGPIDLGVSYKASPAGLYEIGSICAKHYSSETIPSNEELYLDLHYFLNLYSLLAEQRIELESDINEESTGHEGRYIWSLHKRIERDPKLAEEAKRIHGYVCQVCEFDYSKHYLEIGEGFIEAHHLTPLSELRGISIKTDPRRDFAVLCANCHRMIHRVENASDIEEFRSKYIRHK